MIHDYLYQMIDTAAIFLLMVAFLIINTIVLDALKRVKNREE